MEDWQVLAACTQDGSQGAAATRRLSCVSARRPIGQVWLNVSRMS